jgi:hypothetical protein
MSTHTHSKSSWFSLLSGRLNANTVKYSEAQLLQAEVTKHLEQRYAVAYSLQGYVQENFWTSFCSSSLATNSRAVVGYLFLFPAEPPTAFPADPEAFDFAGAFFALDPLPLVFRSSCT